MAQNGIQVGGAFGGTDGTIHDDHGYRPHSSQSSIAWQRPTPSRRMTWRCHLHHPDLASGTRTPTTGQHQLRRRAPTLSEHGNDLSMAARGTTPSIHDRDASTPGSRVPVALYFVQVNPSSASAPAPRLASRSNTACTPRALQAARYLRASSAPLPISRGIRAPMTGAIHRCAFPPSPAPRPLGCERRPIAPAHCGRACHRRSASSWSHHIRLGIDRT